MALILDLVLQGVQMVLVRRHRPAILGVTRKVKARLLRRIGPPLLQPYVDLWKLMHKEAVLAHNASWLYRVAPYLIFAATWVAAALVPSYATGLLFSWSADLIAIVALLGTARFTLALAGMDVGTAFGGIGSSREMMIASLAEPAMLLIVFTRRAGRRHHPALGHRHRLRDRVGRASGVARARHVRVPVGGDRRERAHPDRQSGDASRTDHGARGDGAGIFRPPSRHDRGRRGAQARALFLADRLPVRAVRHRRPGCRARGAARSGSSPISPSSCVLAVLLPIGETSVAKMRVFRYPIFVGGAFAAAALAVFLLFVSQGF